MDVTPLIRAGAQVIQSYAGGKFRVSGQVFEGAIIVTPDETLVWDGGRSVVDLKADSFQFLTAKAPDVVLLGTGKTMAILPLELRRELKALGLAVESMDTGAACRTYNVLMAEGRRVAAVLLPS